MTTPITTIVALLLALSSLHAISQEKKLQEPRLVRLDPRLDDLVQRNATIEKITGGFTWLEGPAWNRKGRYLLFSDIPANSIFMWKEGKGVTLFMKPSGYTGAEPFAGREPGSNGLTFDLDGRLVICEHGDRRITVVEEDGLKKTVVDKYNGKRLNSPNDVVFKLNGDMYFTDPPFGLPKAFDDPAKELAFSGVYRLSVDSTLTLLASEIKAPNGLAFSPDEKKLYITDVDPTRSAWLVYDVRDDGRIDNGRIFYDASTFTKQWPGAPDGIKVDMEGNIYGAGPGGVYIFSPDGTHLGTIETGVATANCAWGDDGSTLYITAGNVIYRIQTLTRGAGWSK